MREHIVKFDLDRAEQLRMEVTRLLQVAKETEGFDFGAVNWGDLYVAEVYGQTDLEVDASENTTYRVEVSEASPDCNLGYWLWQQLAFIGNSDVSIECEW